ncbi:dihydropteroate synthase [Isobaculum melis]|uniref:Dihydropteroate synthase n=1 Tax=Isobaculum melis TaxID=142588 RepID=A0A1H9QVU9_9LACT|nr:dihydropteroate synthase [Isobaculum melis]SER64614.1 Dihydropteroate synthase [Isobaculum melis]
MNQHPIFAKPATQIMGIVNVTPDSFSDGGLFYDTQHAIEHAKQLIKEGVDILDIGGQSTRPGYQEVSEEEELARVAPVIKAIRQLTDLPISIDTYFPSVAKAALALGATILNDVRGLDHPEMLAVAKAFPKAGLIIMHSRPRISTLTIQEDLQAFYQEKIKQCQQANIALERICFDPGIGFGKSLAENIQILQNPDAFRYQDYPLLYGVSRKRTIEHLTGETNPMERDIASITASLYAANQGVEILRIHHVKGMKEALTVWQTLDC